jgi:subtilisin family serine protease
MPCRYCAGSINISVEHFPPTRPPYAIYSLKFKAISSFDARGKPRSRHFLIKALHTMSFFNGLVSRRSVLALSVVACSLPAIAQRPTEIHQGKEVAAKEVIVRFSSTAPPSAVTAVQRLADSDSLRPVGSSGHTYVIHSKSLAVGAVISALGPNSSIVSVEPNYVIRLSATPNDPYFGQQWSLLNSSKPGADIGATSAWDISTGSAANVVGVVDTGIDYTHPDLAPNVWSAPSAFTLTIGGSSIKCPAGSHGYNAINRSCDPADDNGHGTHVSGTIGAVGNNQAGVVGVNWTTRIMGLKFLDSTGSGTVADAIDAIDAAIQIKNLFANTGAANVRVLSNSWGANAFTQSLLNEVNVANSNNILFVAAAGNNGSNNDTNPTYPASYSASNVISVAATDSADALASFSNYGRNTVHLGAPGVYITSTWWPKTYVTASGTSMATPHVSGAAMLLLSACNLSSAALKSTLINNVDLIASMANTTISGGRLNVNKAIRACTGTSGGAPPPPPPPPASYSYSVTPSATSVQPGASMSVSWTAPAGTSNVDWLQLMDTGGNTQYWYQYTGGATSGTATLAMPTSPGQYVFRYLLNNTYTEAARSAIITVTGSTGGGGSSYTVTPSATSLQPGVSMAVSWTAPGGASNIDWIQLMDIGGNTQYWFQYTGGAVSGTATLTAPLGPGQYVFRYLLNNTYTEAARSAVITVTGSTGGGGSSYTITPSATVVSAGAQMSVSWTAPGGSSNIDWLQLMDAGGNIQYWARYTSGAVSGTATLAAPTRPGQYIFRYLLNNTYTEAARTGIITVQ